MRYSARTKSVKSRGHSRPKRSKSRSSAAVVLTGKAGEEEIGIGRAPREHELCDELAHGGSVLEAVSRASAHEPRISRRRMTVDDEVLVRRVLVLAHARLEQRSVLERRKSVPEVLTSGAQRLGRGQAFAARGIERGPARIVRDLEPPPLIAGNAIHEMRAVVGPNRERFLGEATIAARRAEEEDFLPRGPHTVADHIGEQLPKPRPAGEDVAVGDEARAIGECHTGELAPTRRLGVRRELAILTALGEEAIQHGGAGTPRGEVSALPLEDGPADAIAIDLGVALRGLPIRELLELDADILQEGQRRFLVLILALHQPQHPDPVIQLARPPSFVLLPQRQGARGESRVDDAGPVGRANHPRFPARARARVAGPPRVDQRHAGPTPQQIQRGPAAERAGADHHDVWLFGHRAPALRKRQRGQCRAHSPAAFEKRPPRDAFHGRLTRTPRASRTARRTASRSSAGRGGPHGSSHASSGITPSAASAQSIRRTYPSIGGTKVAPANRSHKPDSLTNLPKSPVRNDSIRPSWKFVSAAPNPIKAARAPMVKE